jgi:Fe-S-cluster-containing dehydrogenase component
LALAKVIVVDASKCYACLGCVVECAYHQAGAKADLSLSPGAVSYAGCAAAALTRNQT